MSKALEWIAKEGGRSISSWGQASPCPWVGIWERCKCWKPARKVRCAVLVSVQFHPTVSRLVMHRQSPSEDTHSSLTYSTREHLLSTPDTQKTLQHVLRAHQWWNKYDHSSPPRNGSPLERTGVVATYNVRMKWSSSFGVEVLWGLK